MEILEAMRKPNLHLQNQNARFASYGLRGSNGGAVRAFFDGVGMFGHFLHKSAVQPSFLQFAESNYGFESSGAQCQYLSIDIRLKWKFGKNSACTIGTSDLQFPPDNFLQQKTAGIGWLPPAVFWKMLALNAAHACHSMISSGYCQQRKIKKPAIFSRVPTVRTAHDERIAGFLFLTLDLWA